MPTLSSSVAVKPYPGETVSGDAAIVFDRETDMLAIVSDGLGHGAPAHEASTLVTNWVKAQGPANVSELVSGLHAELQGTIGAAVGIGSISHADMTVRFVGVGNIVGRILGRRPRGLISRPGTLGLAMRTAHVQTDTLEVGEVLVLHSDGVSSSFRLEDYPALLTDKPENSSTEIVRRFGKSYDDASCIVIKCEND